MVHLILYVYCKTGTEEGTFLERQIETLIVILVEHLEPAFKYRSSLDEDGKFRSDMKTD